MPPLTRCTRCLKRMPLDGPRLDHGAELCDDCAEVMASCHDSVDSDWCAQFEPAGPLRQRRTRVAEVEDPRPEVLARS
jgi:hypothetical protein